MKVIIDVSDREFVTTDVQTLYELAVTEARSLVLDQYRTFQRKAFGGQERLARLQKEKLELDERSERLFAFIDSEDFKDLPRSEKQLMDNQYGTMLAYSAILGQRIERIEHIE